FGADALGGAPSDQSLYDLSRLGTNTVAINVWWFQQTASSTTIAEDDARYSSTMSSIQHAIDTIHSLGMNVLLKPMVDVADSNNTWRAQITPTNVNDWFASYTSFIDTFADLAQQNKSKGVTMLSVGCELNSMEQYTTQWNNLIAGVRSRYTGQLTYSANWSATSVGSVNNVGGYTTVPWWNKLDAIGIDAYFPLTNVNNPTETQLQSAWNGLADNIQSWRASQGLSQKVIFTEVGYASQDGSNTAPWSATTSSQVNQQEQANSYQALLTTMSSRPWYDGQFWWSWSTDPLGGYNDPTGFTPQQKSVQSVLANAYGGVVPSVKLPPRLIASWENGLQGFAYTGFGFSGTTVSVATRDATNGQKSLAITTPQSGFNWATTVDLHAGAAGFDNFVIAAQSPQDYILKFDVTYDPAVLPSGNISLSVALNSDDTSGGGWSQKDNLAASSTTTLKTIHVEVPMSSFVLSKTSSYYQFVLGLSTSWGANLAGTVYIDNWQIANTHYLLGDFDGDYQITNADLQAMLSAVKDLGAYQASAGLTASAMLSIADLNGDGKIDAADIQAELRLLTTGSVEGGGQSTAVPEPISLVLLGLAAVSLLSVKRYLL
ncbi:MAG TPA: dockerin type I domain-containing protein, partial [Pirellulales bacterium]